MTSTRTLIVFGAGPGIGNHVASAFASHGMHHIILLSRNTHRLQALDAPFVRAARPSAKVSTLALDLADLPSMPAVLSKLDALTCHQSVQVIFFNAARIHPSPVLSTPVDEINDDLSLYLIAQHFLPLSQPRDSSKPALLVTNSALPHAPVPDLLSLSLVKAAQRNMVPSLRLAFEGQGVHVGLVSVEGQVGPAEEVRNPREIARRMVGLEVRI